MVADDARLPLVAQRAQLFQENLSCGDGVEGALNWSHWCRHH
ncbi:hypothetical protein ACFZA1_39630 [Streptomyces filipinensis]